MPPSRRRRAWAARRSCHAPRWVTSSPWRSSPTLRATWSDSSRGSQPPPYDARVLPLTGIRVVACENGLAGPLATRLLADLGADVVKVERPGSGDVTRGWDTAAKGLSSGFVWVNRGKRSVELDLKDPAARPAV